MFDTETYFVWELSKSESGWFPLTYDLGGDFHSGDDGASLSTFPPGEQKEDIHRSCYPSIWPKPGEAFLSGLV